MDSSRVQDPDLLTLVFRLVSYRSRLIPLCIAVCIRALVARRYAIGIWLVAFLSLACWPLILVNPYEMAASPLKAPHFVSASESSLPDKEKVLAVAYASAAKAYPVRILGYHALLNDTLGAQPIVATYSTISHTGLVWGRDVGGLVLTFRLVGNYLQNFLMQDTVTGSWWQQSSGRGMAGRLSARRLKVIHCDELTFGQWRAEHPDGLVLADDPAYTSKYLTPDWENAAGRIPPVVNFNEDSGLDARDLIVGVHIKDDPRAFRAEALLRARLAMEPLGGSQVLLVAGPDDESIRAWKLPADARPFTRLSEDTGATGPVMADAAGNKWNFEGCDAHGTCLEPVEVVREYWYDWRRRNPESTVSAIR